MTKRVVITSMSALTAVGETLEDTYQNLKQGQSGIGPCTIWPAEESDFPLSADLKNYQPRKMITDKKLLKLISRQDVIGLNAVQQLIESSQIIQYRDSLTENDVFNDRTGVYIGSPGNKFEQQYDFMPLLAKSQGDMQVYAESLFEEVHPMWLLRILPNNVLAYAGIQNNFKGPNENITNHGVSGLQAIGEAFYAIKNNQIDRALVSAYDCGQEAQGQMYYGALGTLSAKHLKPFDEKRDGTILGEGAGALLIESLESAQERGATILGEVLACQTTSEARGVFPINEQGEGITRLIKKTLDQAKIAPSDLGLITAHGNGTVNSDRTEALAIANTINSSVPVTAFKWSIGHTIVAAGCIETALTLKALQDRMAPKIANLDSIASDCQNINITQSDTPISSPIGMILTRAFSGINTALVISSELA